MKPVLSDKLIAYLALISGLSISAVAIYYSVAGLIAIFAAAVVPIMIMGIVLEIGKLSATVWLKQNWERAPRFLKTYLLLAIMSLMLLTSMGIFGYLSKAHLDQAVPTGDVAAKVALLDEKIKSERDNIETARTALKQMDAQVDARLNRSDDEKGAERAVQIRRQQQAERGRLQKEVAEAQARIAKLNEERAPIASELRKVEAEVGPIKYIAALIYGDNPDADLLERAVRWVIIVIVLVFDPLAVILLLASQYSFTWFRKYEEESTEDDVCEEHDFSNGIVGPVLKDDPVPEETNYVHSPWPFPVQDRSIEEPKEEVIEDKPKMLDPLAGMDKDYLSEAKERVQEKIEEIKGNAVPIEQWNAMIAEAEKAAEAESKAEIIIDEQEELAELNSATYDEKIAMQAWKQEHPLHSLKHQRMQFNAGLITKLPWDDPKYYVDSADEAAIEAAKWAQEQLEKNQQPVESDNYNEEDKKKEMISWLEKEGSAQIKKTKEK